MPVSISAYIKRCALDTPPDPHKVVATAPPLSPDAYRFSGNLPIMDADGNIIGTVYTNSRTQKFQAKPLATRNSCLRSY